MPKLFLDCDYLGQFELSRDHISIPDKVFYDLDATIRKHIIYNNAELEDYLIAQTEFLSTFSTAKAEEVNALSADEAKKILGNLLGFAKDDTAAIVPRTKELDVQEYANIVRGFRMVCESGLSAKDLTIDKLKELHLVLTDNLDKLSHGVGGAGPEYNAGELRGGDVWIGGLYTPAKHVNIEKELKAAIKYYQNNQTIADTIIFSLALYAIHPFNNGNKRVCRIIEHGLLRGLGINKENMYSHITETYYNLDRYKDTLKASLGRKVLNSFVNFQLESLYWAQMHTLRAAVEFSRQKRMDGFLQDNKRKHLPELLGSFITAKALQYTGIKQILNGLNDKILSSLLNLCVEKGILLKQVRGKESYYSLELQSPLEIDLIHFYEANAGSLAYIPELFLRSIVRNADIFREKKD